MAARQLIKEYRQLSQSPIEGVQIEMNEQDLSEVTILCNGPQGTPFEGGAFKYVLKMPQDYPSTAPKGHFITRIFHPNIEPISGEICVNTLKKDWDPKTMGIKHIILVIQCLLVQPNPESALNEEAGKLILESYDDYCARARMFTRIHALKQICNTTTITTLGDSTNTQKAQPPTSTDVALFKRQGKTYET